MNKRNNIEELVAGLQMLGYVAVFFGGVAIANGKFEGVLLAIFGGAMGWLSLYVAVDYTVSRRASWL